MKFLKIFREFPLLPDQLFVDDELRMQLLCLMCLVMLYKWPNIKDDDGTLGMDIDCAPRCSHRLLHIRKCDTMTVDSHSDLPKGHEVLQAKVEIAIAIIFCLLDTQVEENCLDLWKSASLKRYLPG